MGALPSILLPVQECCSVFRLVPCSTEDLYGVLCCVIKDIRGGRRAGGWERKKKKERKKEGGAQAGGWERKKKKEQRKVVMAIMPVSQQLECSSAQQSGHGFNSHLGIFSKFVTA